MRNLLAAPTLLRGGNRSHIPVCGGPKTGSLVWVEKNGKGWNFRVDEAPELVEAMGKFAAGDLVQMPDSNAQ